MPRPSMQHFSITQYLERHLQLFGHFGLLPKCSLQLHALTTSP